MPTLRIDQHKPDKMMYKHLKYKINQFIDELPNRIGIGDITDKLLPHGITYDTFNRDRKIKLTDSTSIPSDRLQVYAGLFDCSIEDMMNSRKKVKPLVKQSVANRLGIKTKKL